MHIYRLDFGNRFFPAAQIFCSAARRHDENCRKLGLCTVALLDIRLYSKCHFPAHHCRYQFWAAVELAVHREQQALNVQIEVAALEDPCDTRGFPIQAQHHPGQALCQRSLRTFFKTMHSFFLSQFLGFEVKHETEPSCNNIPLELRCR